MKVENCLKEILAPDNDILFLILMEKERMKDVPPPPGPDFSIPKLPPTHFGNATLKKKIV